MTIKDDMIRTGYLPENLPPSFHTRGIADYFVGHARPQRVSTGRAYQAATYSASKRGLTRRVFSVVHPAVAHDLAGFVQQHWAEIQNFLNQSSISLSVPTHTPNSPRSFAITSHSELDEIRHSRLASYRFIARTDISRFYHSIYTHSLPWAFHGKAAAKLDRSVQSAAIFFNRLDFIFRQNQDGQTIGLPVGPDASRIAAEVIACAIDAGFSSRTTHLRVEAIRHVDDVWIGANTYAEAEEALWHYRSSIREFELDINESKTRIHSEGFQFSEEWPAEIASRIDYALRTETDRSAERVRSALEYAFRTAVREGDDGILRFAIKQMDRADQRRAGWNSFEPFLKRVTSHFGHAIDYVVRVLVWRQLVRHDLDVDRWAPLLLSALKRHGSLGNDSEVCWILYACYRLGIVIPRDSGDAIVENCGALSIIALLRAAADNLASDEAFVSAFEFAITGSPNGAWWPLYLEWIAQEWPGHDALEACAAGDLIAEMAAARVRIYDPNLLPRVFEGIETVNFEQIAFAIEAGGSFYDADEEPEDSGVEF